MGSIHSVAAREENRVNSLACCFLTERKKKIAITLLALMAISLLIAGIIACMLSAIGAVSPMSMLPGIILTSFGGLVALAIGSYCAFQRHTRYRAFPSLNVHTSDRSDFKLKSLQQTLKTERPSFMN